MEKSAAGDIGLHATPSAAIRTDPPEPTASQADANALGAAGPARPAAAQVGSSAPATSQDKIKFLYNIGRSYITVLEHQGHHYRLDRKDEISKIRQRWPCRWAPSHKCRAKIILTMRETGNLENFAKMEKLGEHNHEPRELIQDRSTQPGSNELAAADPFVQQQSAPAAAPLAQVTTASTDSPTTFRNGQADISTGEASTPRTHLSQDSWDESNISFDFRRHVATSASHSSPLVTQPARENSQIPGPLAPILEEGPVTYEPSRNHSFWDATN